MPLKDIIDYHRLVLSEGVCLTSKDAMNVVVFLQWVGPSLLRPPERIVLRVLKRFYIDTKLIDESIFTQMSL